MKEREKALEEVKRMNPNAENIHVVNMHPDFLGGTLYVVGFDHDGGNWHNYVHADDSGFHLTKNEALLISMTSKKHKQGSLLDSIGGVAGIIRLAITGAIIYLLTQNPRYEIPQVLSAAPTAILGFYFGSQIKR